MNETIPKGKMSKAFQIHRDVTNLKEIMRKDQNRKLEIAKEQKELTARMKENNDKLFDILDKFDEEMKTLMT